MTTRRRFLTILAGAATLPVLGANASNQMATWHGVALGANAQIILDHPDAENLLALALREIHRLEAIFSLYKADSQISRLNRDGSLQNPAFEMVELLSICSTLNARTSGAFDPTVQSLWALYANQYSANGRPSQNQITKILNVTGWEHVRFDTDQVVFDQPGVQITLNGIAQGFIADKITELFRSAGIKNVLVNTGEVSALGRAPNGDDWQVKLGNSTGDAIQLNNSAVATSAILGTTFDNSGKVGHIIDPRTGHIGNRWTQISVVAKSAAQADGLSTAFCLMNRDEIDASSGEERVILT